MQVNQVIYMTPDEVRTLDPTQISSMTMTSGDIIYVNEQFQECEGSICNSCAMKSKMNNQQTQNYIFRTKKEDKVQEEIDVEPQPEGEDSKVLRGPNGELLIDIITGNNTLGGEQMNQEQQQIDENANYQQQEQNVEQNYEQADMNQNQVGEEQYVQEQNEEMNNNENEQQYYDPNNDPYAYQENPNYYPEEGQNEPNYPTQNVGEQYVEQEYQEQIEQGQEGQENSYPTFEENEQYPQAEYQPPMNAPQEEQAPEVEELNQPPLQEPVQYPSPMQPAQQLEQPPLQEPVQYPSPVQPGKIPIQPPSQKFPVAKDIKGFVPKNPKIVGPKIGKGFIKIQGPRRPMMPMMPMPNGPKFIPPKQSHFGPGIKKNVFINPVGKILNAVHQVVTPIAGMAAKKLAIKVAGKGRQGNVFRARKQNTYSNAGYNQQRTNLSSNYNSLGYGYNYGNAYATNTSGNENNYHFHEIVETTDNSKSYVVAKKDGITVSSDQ